LNIVDEFMEPDGNWDEELLRKKNCLIDMNILSIPLSEHDMDDFVA
jgi:hypothetical protein